MKESKTSPETPHKNADKRVIGLLERMLEDCKVLCREEDPVLQGQMQVILAVLADVLEVKDPHHHFQHVVEYE